MNIESTSAAGRCGRKSSSPYCLPAGSPFHPAGDRLTVRIKKTTTLGNILLTAEASPLPILGRVIEVGPGEVDKKGRSQAECKAGDLILYKPELAMDVFIGEERILLMPFASVIAVVHDE
jgi:co-chaperonin GroES (HSP10)